MKTLKRINVDKVREMFDYAGIKAEQYNSYACLMAVAILPLNGVTVENVKKAGFDPAYCYGIIEGFDNKTNYYTGDKKCVPYKLGLADGTAARKILFGK